MTTSTEQQFLSELDHEIWTVAVYKHAVLRDTLLTKLMREEVRVKANNHSTITN